MTILHDPRCTGYDFPGHPERPARIEKTVSHLKTTHPDWTWRVPRAATDGELRLVHTAEHLARVQKGPAFDADTGWMPEMADHAARSGGSALEAARVALGTGEKTFSLMRPPGHHATADRAMGFCYFNAIALAAVAARQAGVERVAIWDFDAHHGNGTEAIVDGREGILFASVHQWPGYPGSGVNSRGNCRNWTVSPGAPREEHRRALAESWAAVVGYRPGLVLVSAGFDAYAGDPITEMTLGTRDFAELGRWLAGTKVPAAAVLEGGYSDELPSLIDAFLSEWAAR